MINDGILIKGNKDGLNAVISMEKFADFSEASELLLKKLMKGKEFYKGCTLKITSNLRYISEREQNKLRHILFEQFFIADCTFEDIEEKKDRIFSGIYEGKTKFIKKTIRGGQCINYNGNIVIIGDVNPGAEVYAYGNIIVLGHARGSLHAGCNGNEKAIISAFCLQPEIMQISNTLTRAPEEGNKPSYPEVAKLKDGIIIVEPYLANKYI